MTEGEIIEKLCSERGWNHADLVREATRAGHEVSYSVIARITAGKTKHLNPRTLVAVASTLGVAPAVIRGEEPVSEEQYQVSPELRARMHALLDEGLKSPDYQAVVRALEAGERRTRRKDDKKRKEPGR